MDDLEEDIKRFFQSPTQRWLKKSFFPKILVLARYLLGRCRVWSAEWAVFWARQVRDNPENNIEGLYQAAHKLHLFFYWLRLPGELQLTDEANKELREQIFGSNDIGFPD